jgi:hypothetical protein
MIVMNGIVPSSELSLASGIDGWILELRLILRQTIGIFLFLEEDDDISTF